MNPGISYSRSKNWFFTEEDKSVFELVISFTDNINAAYSALSEFLFIAAIEQLTDLTLFLDKMISQSLYLSSFDFFEGEKTVLRIFVTSCFLYCC